LNCSLDKEDIRLMFEIIEEKVFDPHCSEINDKLVEMGSSDPYEFTFTEYILRVLDGLENEFPATPSRYVPGCYFDLYRRLKGIYKS